MSAILYRLNSAWILEAKFPGSYHVAWRLEFPSARAARAYAKLSGSRVSRAIGCDSLGDELSKSLA